MIISEESLYYLKEELKKDLIGTSKVHHGMDFYSDSFSDYLYEQDTEELELCRISSTPEDIYFFFSMCYDDEEVLAIEIYYDEYGVITDIVVGAIR